PVADDVYPFDIGGSQVAEHQAQAAPDGLLRQNVGFGGVGAQADDDRDVLHVPAFSEHEDADDAVEGAIGGVGAAGDLAGLLHIFFADLAAPVGMDVEQPVAAELGRI